MKSTTHIVHELEFRGTNVIERRSQFRIALAGVGAVGSFLLDGLSRQGYESLFCIDKDRVERSNLGTQLYDATDIGKPKAVQAANRVFRRLGIRVENAVQEVTKNNIGRISSIRNADLVVDMFDNPESRLLLRDFCLEHDIDCVHAGMGTIGFFEVLWNTPDYTCQGEGDGPCDYPLATNLVTLCASTTAEVVNRFVDKGEKINTEFWLKSLKFERVEK